MRGESTVEIYLLYPVPMNVAFIKVLLHLRLVLLISHYCPRTDLCCQCHRGESSVATFNYIQTELQPNIQLQNDSRNKTNIFNDNAGAPRDHCLTKKGTRLSSRGMENALWWNRAGAHCIDPGIGHPGMRYAPCRSKSQRSQACLVPHGVGRFRPSNPGGGGHERQS